MDTPVYCDLRHISSKEDAQQIVTNIKTFVNPKRFDASGIQECGTGKNDSVTFQITRGEANKIRDQLVKILPKEDSSIWFSIRSEPLDSLIPRTLDTIDPNRHQGSKFRATCRFGSLFSHNQFYSHVTFDNKIVQVTFKPERQTPESLYIEFDKNRIVIPFKSIQKDNIVVNKENAKNGVYVLLSLKYLPNIFQMVPAKSGNATGQNGEKPSRLCADEKNIDFMAAIVHCSDVLFHFLPAPDTPWMFLQHFLIGELEKFKINFSCFKISDWVINGTSRPDPFSYNSAPFQDRYGLQMLVSLGFMFRDKWARLTDQELKWNTMDPDDRYKLCCFAAEKLKEDHGYDLKRTVNDYRQWKEGSEKSDKKDDQQNMLVNKRQRLQVACCTLTPLKTIFQPLEITIGSRALRNPRFGGPERFLLVHFCDEDNRQLRVTNYNIKRRLRNSMKDGIELFKNKYQYFGASTGQMKEMGFWFIDLPLNFKDIKEAHKEMGDFDQIRNISTYIARVGQYFSTTWPVDIRLVQVNAENRILPNDASYYAYKIDDIERNGYCFTDGIGKISLGLAGRVAQKMNIPISCLEDIPSAFQVRVAGCKGMVAIDPESTLNDYYIHVRDSMMKFPSHDWTLEICEFARPMPLTLNNQVIRLLSDLGNPDGQFINLQNRAFDNDWHVPEEQQPSATDIAVQRKMMYSFSKDNLLTNRIPIPTEDGRNLFGVADETGELQYGECFIKYSVLNLRNKAERRYRVIQGPVIVTKNPCLWPGDCRRLQAVRNSKLEKYMRDVIVFPTQGPRPHSKEIAGSDLDGDQYWVYWGDQFEIKTNVDPLSYKGAKKLETASMSPDDIINHIIECFSSGIMVGMIANTHTVVADKHTQHSFSKECKELADLFSIAVDSPKTGHFVEKETLRPYQAKYCNSWPKHMRKPDESSYDSNSVLEQLFNKAVERYHNLRQSPFVTMFPQQMRAIKGASANTVTDKKFEKWLGGGTYDEKQSHQKKTNKANGDDSSNTDSKLDAVKLTDDSPPVPKIRYRRKSQSDLPRSATPKERQNPSKSTSKKVQKQESTSQMIGSNGDAFLPDPSTKQSFEKKNETNPSAPKYHGRQKLQDDSSRPETPIEPKVPRKAATKKSLEKENSSKSIVSRGDASILDSSVDQISARKTEINSLGARNRGRRKSLDDISQIETPMKLLSLKNDNATQLINSSNRASNASTSSAASSSLSSLIPEGTETDFILAIPIKATDATVIQCNSDASNRYSVDPKKEATGDPTEDQIKDKVKPHLEKSDVFKPRSSYKSNIHGTPHLVVFYGRIHFTSSIQGLEKLGQLKKMIKENGSQCVRFDHAQIEKLTIVQAAQSTTKKNKIQYEFDCRIESSPSEYFTLLYDDKKTLQQIRMYYVWSRCLVRQPGFNTDSLYEIRSSTTYEKTSADFSRIMNSIFNSSTEPQLSGRKPNILINPTILKNGVTPLFLKVLDEDREVYIKDGMDSFYRKVHYVSLDETQEKPSVLSTMEYHVGPIEKDFLEQICRFACSPVMPS